MKKVTFKIVLIFFISILSCAIAPCTEKAMAARSYSAHDFIQTDWSDGASSDTVSLSQFSTWKKYSSISGSLTADTNINNPGGSGEVVSNPINLENREVHFIYGNTCIAENGGRVYGRTANTVGGLDSTPWTEYTSTEGGYLSSQYFQYKVALADPCYIATDVKLAISETAIGGYITDSNTGEPLQEYTVSGETCDTYEWPSGMGVPGPFYLSCDYAVGDTTKTITVTAPGYTPQTKIIAISQNDWHTGNMNMSESGRQPRVLAAHTEASVSYEAQVAFNLTTAGSALPGSDPTAGVTILPRTGSSQLLSVAVSSALLLAILSCRRLVFVILKNRD